MSVYKLQSGLLYGPVESRRLGRSLGINLSPRKSKLCSFNCIYCHYGWTKRQALDLEPYREELPAVNEISHEVEQVMISDLDFDYVTFSGNGEPTLHPDFPAMVAEMRRLRDEYRPEVKLGLLSNATGLYRDDVLAAVRSIDYPMFKLDAGTPELFEQINRPVEGVSFNEIVEKLSQLESIILQTLMIDGDPSSIDEANLAAWMIQVRKIAPREVHIYSIDRPVPAKGIRLVPPEILDAVAQRCMRETGISTKAYYPQKR